LTGEEQIMGKYNVICIALDTLRADHLGAYGYPKKTSPAIDAFASSSSVFTNFFAPGIPTQPSYSTVFTGQYPLTHGIIAHGTAFYGEKPINPNSPLLPVIMAENKYLTSAVDNLANMKPWFLNGYEFYTTPATTRIQNFYQTVQAEDITKRATEWLERYHRENFFLFVHYWDPHTPYLPPEDLVPLFYPKDKNPYNPEDTRMKEFYQTPHGKAWSKTWLTKQGKLITDPEYVEALYDAEIRYMDGWLEKFFYFCKSKGLFNNTVFVIFSDHGEIMYSHPGFFDHHGLYDCNIHCPLIVYVPDLKPCRIDFLTQHVDIAPTILNLCNIPVDPKMEGNDLSGYLFNTKRDETYDFLVTEECTYQAKWAIRIKEHKLIVSRNDKDIHGCPPVELYDLTTDKAEQKNIAVCQRETVNALQAKMELWIADMLRKNNLDEDPLKYTEPPLGANWDKFVAKHKYW